ncbi:conserved hypothetical protein [Sporisorium reilianum SRZ2]|uniref:GATOR1 complex protein NPRL3 C-terminal HTH domain-containing protein n=1 Tax=Sporisorium reilianum (strain SRZ2) TaxID=999809 RepID=E7A1P0_SPORE|nr:conserved hypothetical protein [Sporisorium reilianum SRZ2]
MSEPLLGVILATSSSRGDHIVFRWPNNPKLFKRYSKVKYYTESRPLHRAHLDDELDPVRQKAKWDRHDEDDDDHADADSDDGRQSDTPSSSDFEDSDGTLADDDENRSVRDRADTVISHGRSKTGAAASAARSKSKARRPLLGMEEASASVRSADRHASAHKDANDAHDRAPESDAGTSKELSPEEKARREERATRAYKTYLGYDIEILASILNPRPELAHQKFELVVDDLAFLGHPVAATKGGTWSDESDEGKDNDKDGHGSNDKAAAQAQQRGRSGLRKEIRPYDLPDGSDNLDKAPAASDKQAANKDTTPSAKSRNVSQTRMEPTHDALPSSRSQAPLTQFHLVLVLDRPDPSSAMAGMDLSSWLQLYYDNVVFKMTAALFAEQSKCDYVGRETEKLLALRERCMDDGQAYAAYAAQCLGISSLARCIRDLHRSISTSCDALITVNDRMEVDLQLPPILQDPNSLPKLVDIETELDPNDPAFLSGNGFAGRGKEGADEDGGGSTHDRLRTLNPSQLSMEEWCRTTGPYLVPWKTLLLLHDQPDDTPARGRDGSPAGPVSPGGAPAPEVRGFEQLSRTFTDYFKPRLHGSFNFSDVADFFGWHLYDDVYPMVRHLIYYRQARVIDVPRPGHVYAISPLFDFARLGALSRVWAHAFPDVAPLPVFLSQLSSSSRALSALFPARHQRELALDVLVWLLRHDVVVKMHIRLRLIATEAVKRRTAERSRERHERHRAKREKRRQRAARAEARRMRKSQAEEQLRRRAAEAAEREARGRSRDSDRVRPVDVVRGEEEERERGQVDVQTSGLSVSRPPILAHPDSVAEAALAAAAIAGSGGDEAGRPHHHHHRHHRHHHRHQQHGSDSNGGTDSAAAVITSDKAPIPIAPRPQFDELKFERRPVLRSRSPSTAMVAAATSTLSVSFSNLSERGEIGRRARADTTGSSSSGGALAHARNRSDGLSMTPSRSQLSRPTTPSVAGRNIPLHIRDRSVGASGSSHPSSAEGSLPRRARRATSSAGWGGRRGVARSRSPSRARMRVKGFGVGAEVEIDDDDGEEEEVVGEVEVMGLGLGLGEGEGKTKRRISTASERPDLPPPSESACSDGGKGASQPSGSKRDSASSCSSSASSSSDESSSSDLSLSSDIDTDSDASTSDAHARRHAHASPLLSSSVSPSSSPRFSRARRSATHAAAREGVYTESLIVEPARASRRENEYIATMVEGKDALTVKRFFRLLPFLNGKHTVDEIEYRVGMRRKDIRRLLVTFREYIVTFMHP